MNFSTTVNLFSFHFGIFLITFCLFGLSSQDNLNRQCAANTELVFLAKYELKKPSGSNLTDADLAATKQIKVEVYQSDVMC